MNRDKSFPKGLAALLLLATCLVYTPALRGGFLWDDDAYISENNALKTVQGLRDIWMKPGATPQYYPVTFTVFWLEYHVWGLRPLGYHLVNVLLHGANAILFGVILMTLGLSGAAIAACLFALHPVMVESVAWMTELKNVLSTFFYLLTVLVLIKNDRVKATRLPQEAILLFLFLLAILSKSVTVTLPVVFLVMSTWFSESWDKKKFKRVLPLIGLGLGAALFTIYFEHHLVRAKGPTWDYTWVERFLIAGRAFWFYLLKLIDPSPLVFIYPKWNIHTDTIGPYLYPVLAALFLGGVAYGRRWWGKIPFACLVFFLVSLSPALGLSSFYFMRFSFVADHFQYLASLGIFALAGWGISKLLSQLQVPETSVASLTLIGMLCATLGLKTANQAGTYADPTQLWEHTLSYNADSAIAHHNMGIALSKKGNLNLAVAHLRTAEALDPSFPQTHLALAYLAVHAKRWEVARHHYQEAIRLGIDDPQVLKDFSALPN